jgi:tRNA(adenine34) deaminase
MDLFNIDSPHKTDERYMRIALDEAAAAEDHDDVPVGAIIVHNNRVIGRGHNERERLLDPTAHAEILAISAAAQHMKSWRLIDCDLYVTLEPCLMCAGAIVHARVRRLIFGAHDPKAGACGSLYDIPADTRLNHNPTITPGILEHDCRTILKRFFEKQRALGKK